MANKLSQIIENKRREVTQRKKTRDFLGSIKKSGKGDVSIIAEVKLASPAGGKLGEEKDIEKRVLLYEESHADAISLVVDKKYFGGDLSFIKRIKDTVSLPILAKDFIVDPYQIQELRYCGADAVLLIAKILSKNQLKEFVNLALESGLEPVVEINRIAELEDAVSTETRLIAVNARDLKTFGIDIPKACRLMKSIPKKFIALGFSGVSNRDDVKKYKMAGAKGVLVGTSLMRAKNIQGMIKELKGL